MKDLKGPRVDDVFSPAGVWPNKHHPRSLMNRTGCDVDDAEPILEIELKKAVVPRRERMVFLIAAQRGGSDSKMIDEWA